MNIITPIIHQSWNPLLHQLYQPPLLDLIATGLQDISFRPRREEIFKSFSMPVEDVKVVVMKDEPGYHHEWEAPQYLKDQGVLLLYASLTTDVARPGNHASYWENWTQRVVSYLSHKNPCIWLMTEKNIQKFIPYININPYHVKGYDKETINKIPANSDWNYIITDGKDSHDFMNKILIKTKNTVILW